MNRALIWLIAAALAACTGPSDDSGDTDPDTDPDTDTDTDTDTGVAACTTPKVIFDPDAGAEQDVTSLFQAGDPLTLALPGTLKVCPSTWFALVRIRANVDIVGLGTSPAQTVLSGGEVGTILDIAGPNVTVTVDNLTLDRGAGLDVDHNSGGGGLYCEQDGVVKVTNVHFTNNFANDGSGLYSRNCDVDVRSSRFVDNLSEDDGGGATFWFSTVILDDVHFENNQALDGGGIALFETDLVMRNSTVKGNRSTQFAGGIWASDSAIYLTDVTLEANRNTGTTQYGGGLIVQGSAVLDRVTFKDNAAPKGGGLFVYYNGEVDGSACNFSGNTPDAIYAASSSGGRTYSAGSNYSFSCSNSSCSEK